MGMDVYGKNPASSIGEYFRNNVWWWRPLWDYCEHVAPELTNKVEHAGSNDGDGLGTRDSKKLAKILRLNIESGNTKKYEEDYKSKMAALPKEDCDICGATGKRATPPNIGPGDMSCNGCDGKGQRESWSASYPFSAQNVEEFAAFLAECGGFQIC